jgi:antitoxin (DNA-binding transcriptional repressor) of toxin-antitoxin stability system
MRNIDMAKSRRSLASYIRELDGGEPLVVKKNGKPIAALVPLTDMDWESFAVSTNPTFRKIIEEARKSFKLHGGLSTEEVCEQLGIKLAKRHRNGVSRAVPTRRAG